MKKFRFRPSESANSANVAKAIEKQKLENDNAMLTPANVSDNEAAGTEKLAHVSNGSSSANACNQVKNSNVRNISRINCEKRKEDSPGPEQGKDGKSIFAAELASHNRAGDSQQTHSLTFPSVLRIEAMTECLNGQRCLYLEAPGAQRPVCKKNGIPIFDIHTCPLNRWSTQRLRR